MAMASAGTVFFPPLLTDPSSPVADPQNLQFQHITNGKFEPLKWCTSLPEIRQVQGQCTKHGLMEDPRILAKFVVKYSGMCSHESMESARKAFEIYKHRRDDFCSTAYLYNSLIRGSSSAGAFAEAILVYIDMLMEGVAPDNYTFPFVLSACAKGLMHFEGEQIHGTLLKLGFRNDVFVMNSLVYFYGEFGEIDLARKVFDEMPLRNVVSWTSLICGYARRDRHKEAVSLFSEMVDEGIEPNEVTLVSVISSCAKLGDLDLGQRVLDRVGHGESSSINGFVVNALVDMYMKCGAEAIARRIFDRCLVKNLVHYNTILSNYVKLGKVKEAGDVLREMLGLGLKPDRVTVLSIVALSAETGDVCFGMQSHGYVVRNGLESWESIGNSLIDMYSKCGHQLWACRVFDRMANKSVVSWNSLLTGFSGNGDVESARRLFYRMPERDIVTWNAMIGAFVHHGFFSDAVELFRSMQSEGIVADEATMVSIAAACGYLGALNLATWIHNYIKKYGIRRNVRLDTALVDMFARCGAPKSAMEVFRSMTERDVSAWTAAIRATAVDGNGEHAADLFDEMVREGTRPDEVAFSAALTACSDAGLVERGMNIFDAMQEHGITPHIVHYGCALDLLGRAGLLEEALDFISAMPMEPNGAIWAAFFSACRAHKNEEIAARAAAMAIDTSANIGTGILIKHMRAPSARK
ncbi:pentatricopeptide repeat-containing protein At3g22690 [Andrographis paniculata]|uniref:pentatricopeptide repeat-containing protein At3g22690 n=1 Tax=Andrographis paniculata TaxID=175694 RepID=UPI0021E83325|nr:pentatricopeptide repeat-containing protein At3g22690 [Andrographis paniculata]